MDIERLLRPAEQWDTKYRQAVIAAIWKHHPENADRIVQRYLSRERRAEFNLTNTYARQIFRRELLLCALDLESDLFRPGRVVMLASIADRDWACCDRHIDFDYEATKQKIRNAFVGMNFIGVIEPGYYPNIEWERDGRVGCLISFHAHVVVWDTSKSKLRRHQKRIRCRFEPVAPDDRSLPRLNELKALKDLIKTLRYSTKMPFEGYDRHERSKNDGRHDGAVASRHFGVDRAPASIGQSHVELQPIHHLRLFAFMRKHCLFDAWLAGGDGAKLLRDAKRSALKAARET
jgi:hypothetical protein